MSAHTLQEYHLDTLKEDFWFVYISDLRKIVDEILSFRGQNIYKRNKQESFIVSEEVFQSIIANIVKWQNALETSMKRKVDKILKEKGKSNKDFWELSESASMIKVPDQKFLYTNLHLLYPELTTTILIRIIQTKPLWFIVIKWRTYLMEEFWAEFHKLILTYHNRCPVNMYVPRNFWKKDDLYAKLLKQWVDMS